MITPFVRSSANRLALPSVALIFLLVLAACRNQDPSVPGGANPLSTDPGLQQPGRYVQRNVKVSRHTGAATNTEVGHPMMPATGTIEDLPPFADDEIVITSIQVRGSNGSEIYVEGTTTFSADTCIRTALLAEGALVNWWPADTCVSRNGEHWHLSTALPAGTLDPAAIYTLEAESDTEPAITAVPFHFDVSPPP